MQPLEAPVLRDEGQHLRLALGEAPFELRDVFVQRQLATAQTLGQGGEGKGKWLHTKRWRDYSSPSPCAIAPPSPSGRGSSA